MSNLTFAGTVLIPLSGHLDWHTPGKPYEDKLRERLVPGGSGLNVHVVANAWERRGDYFSTETTGPDARRLDEMIKANADALELRYAYCNNVLDSAEALDHFVARRVTGQITPNDVEILKNRLDRPA